MFHVKKGPRKAVLNNSLQTFAKIHGRVFYAIIADADINSFKSVDTFVYQNFNEKFWKNSLVFGVEVEYVLSAREIANSEIRPYLM